MKLRPIVFMLSILAAAQLHAEDAAFDARRLLTEAIGHAKDMALRSHSVDWPSLEAQVQAAGASAHDQIDLLPALELLVEGLGDGHSFVQVSPEQHAAFEARYGRRFDSTRHYPMLKSTYWPRREPSGRQLAIGARQATLVVVPKYAGDIAGGAAYADKLYASVASGAAQSCGYLLDLRGNVGGNMWPMLAGVGALLGQGPVISSIDRDGGQAMSASVGNGTASNIVSGKAYTVMQLPNTTPLPGLAALPVAVLVDDGVSSSGEAVAVAFHGRPKTRSFGIRTSGKATMNRGFKVAGIQVLVTTGQMADRDGKVFPDGLEPDEQVHEVPEADLVVDAGLAWLARQPECSG